jgi:hypothetical protein
MLRKLICVLTPVVGIILSGCMSAPAGLSPSTMPITAKDKYVVIVRDISESQSTSYLLGLFPIGLPPSTYDMIQEVKKKYNADGMINVTAENRCVFYFAFSVETIIIRGDVIKFSRIGGADVD